MEGLAHILLVLIGLCFPRRTKEGKVKKIPDNELPNGKSLNDWG